MSAPNEGTAVTASTWCRQCRTKQPITGTPVASPGGVLRVRGRCPACATRLHTIVGKETAR
ncbi:hypothetical protein GCM10022251_19770 [Phytohabitans flavus]|uniref:DUF5679 domain-containing protein n=1 Tax=Phytohabitans flavus TaxID=1076124 RepID=A0A6F8XZ64_9ACTN|nr:hypothetical protein [Phytohabitans flavus]BCB79152.1 hypothetical protein Pflav_055620 [Phytohabitans flavus]